jgi:hypothetical protein
MNKKGASKKGLLLVAFAAFISTGVFGEGKNIEGYEAVEARNGFFYSELSGSDTYASVPQSEDNAKPPLAMTTALKLDESLVAHLRLSIASDKSVTPYFVTDFTGITRWTRSDLEAAAGNTSDSNGDVSYGIGADFDLAEDAKINVEYRDYVNGSKVEVSGFSFGASWTF